MDVNKTGLNLFEEKKIISSIFFAFFIKSTITIPSFTTTPASPTIPIIPSIVIFIPIK